MRELLGRSAIVECSTYAVHGLLLNRFIPPRIKEVDKVGPGEVDTDTTGMQAAFPVDIISPRNQVSRMLQV